MDHIPHLLFTGGPQLSKPLHTSGSLYVSGTGSHLLSPLCIVHSLPGHTKDAQGNWTQTDRIYKDIKSFFQGDGNLADNLTGELKASLNKPQCIKPMPQME